MEREITIHLPNGEDHKFRPVKEVPITPAKREIIFPDKKVHRVDWRTDFKVMQDTQAQIKEAEVTQKEATVNVPLDIKDLPCLVWIPSDKHIGSAQTDYQLLKDHTELVINTPNAFEISIGDDVDNGIWGGLAFEQVLPPQMQGFMIKDLAEEMNGRNDRKKCITLARCTGNHTDWGFDKTGESWESIWYGSSDAPIFAGMGLVRLHVGDQEYQVAISHRYWGQSKLNPTNACKRFLEYEYTEADCALIGHDHVAEILEFYRNGKRRIAAKTGTYKMEDQWARKQGISGRGQRGGMAILFWPDEHRMQPFLKLEDAVSYLNLLKEIKGF